MAERVLVTGGAGFIGSHTCVELLAAGWDVTVIDDLSNSSPEALRRVEELAGRGLRFVEGDVLDDAALEQAFGEGGCSAVIHFAARKAVGESCSDPLGYYRTNVGGTLSLLRTMRRHDVRRLVFSSSATVYGDPGPGACPLAESAPLRPSNPYGYTKLCVERMLRDLAASEEGWRILSLRYFNPAGAHPSGRIGEDPRGRPENLLPGAMQVAVGRLPQLRVFGTDYPTRDGTAIRDYLHVVDVATGHLRALDHVPAVDGCAEYNLGTGRGVTVFEVLDAVRRASDREIPTVLEGRRQGDATEVWADPALACRDLAWTAERGLDDICVDAWRWQSANPEGFGS
ncbi:MAG: UDP-glucose 4-epimerase GalE [Holophagales bacterium]|nr:UDP-glucose 4-epimerase GalE [Holophagales bacterium]MYG31301.1 UDP-glucose 4-epimerase GalE [Holophagales bacterium]MYI78895.1 UDP-glucose 4-epimerase GalE [Holophagales bacterium]